MRTTPDLTSTSPAHIEAAKDKNYLWEWNRNVIDEFKSLTNDEIKAKLRETAFPYAVCIEHWLQDFNIATCIRNANAFNASEVFYLGEKKWHRTGSLGVQNYTPIKFLQSIDEFLKLKTKYTIVGVDNYSGAIPINNFEYPDNPLFVFGGEGPGLTPGMQELCEHMIYIPQFGSVRSINAGTASGIIMNDFVTKFIFKN